MCQRFLTKAYFLENRNFSSISKIDWKIEVNRKLSLEIFLKLSVLARKTKIFYQNFSSKIRLEKNNSKIYFAKIRTLKTPFQSTFTPQKIRSKNLSKSPLFSNFSSQKFYFAHNSVTMMPIHSSWWPMRRKCAQSIHRKPNLRFFCTKVTKITKNGQILRDFGQNSKQLIKSEKNEAFTGVFRKVFSCKNFQNIFEKI